MNHDRRFATLEIAFPPVGDPCGNYVHLVNDNGILYLAGRGVGKGSGKLGDDFSVEEGYEISRQTGLLLLATIREADGTLNVVSRELDGSGFQKSVVRSLCCGGFAGRVIRWQISGQTTAALKGMSETRGRDFRVNPQSAETQRSLAHARSDATFSAERTASGRVFFISLRMC